MKTRFLPALFRPVLIAAACALPIGLTHAPAAAQFKSDLPNLGDTERSELSPRAERKLGEEIMQKVRLDPDYLDDAPTLEYLNRIGNARQLALVLNQIPGVVENGLFIDICDTVVVGHPDGRVQVRDINSGRFDEDRVALPPVENIFAGQD